MATQNGMAPTVSEIPSRSNVFRAVSRRPRTAQTRRVPLRAMPEAGSRAMWSPRNHLRTHRNSRCRRHHTSHQSGETGHQHCARNLLRPRRRRGSRSRRSVIFAKHCGPQPADAVHRMDFRMGESAYREAPQVSAGESNSVGAWPLRELAVPMRGDIRSARRALRMTATSIASCRSAPSTGAR